MRLGQPGRSVHPLYKTNKLRASGEEPDSIQLDTTLFNAFTERRKSPNPPKKVASKGIRRTIVRNDRELKCWLDFRLNLKRGSRLIVRRHGRRGLNPFVLLRAAKVNSFVTLLF